MTGATALDTRPQGTSPTATEWKLHITTIRVSPQAQATLLGIGVTAYCHLNAREGRIPPKGVTVSGPSGEVYMFRIALVVAPIRALPAPEPMRSYGLFNTLYTRGSCRLLGYMRLTPGPLV